MTESLTDELTESEFLAALDVEIVLKLKRFKQEATFAFLFRWFLYKVLIFIVY